MARKETKKTIIKKIVRLKKLNKTDKEIMAIVPVSQSTITKTVKNNKNEIEASKQKYIKLIDKAIGGDKKQSKVLANILKAKTDIYNFKGDVVGVRPDYKVRLEAIKYIDKLKGREQQSIKLNQTNNYLNGELDKYIK